MARIIPFCRYLSVWHRIPNSPDSYLERKKRRREEKRRRGCGRRVHFLQPVRKVLDANSNEPWDPHGTFLAQIAHASANNYE
ncbi:hypothetical protein MLD38_038444 [Melastoma candidum]|uniref:Uncharacterized protein n=1 Tax=Melastoma candidum TaxID=119954 RepID=A0ACB9KZY7_9MYRT|nr:hypothetical protein MLD38_038444 [Melastoma candidum]